MAPIMFADDRLLQTGLHRSMSSTPTAADYRIPNGCTAGDYFDGEYRQGAGPGSYAVPGHGGATPPDPQGL